jgi:hypothetical protein
MWWNIWQEKIMKIYNKAVITAKKWKFWNTLKIIF